MLRYCFILLLVLPACTDPNATLEAQQEQYHQAHLLAERQPTYPVVGPGFRLGMDSAQVRHHLDSLRMRDELNWRLSLGPVMTTYAPSYNAGKLLELTLLLQAGGQPGALAHLELQRGLRRAYGDAGCPHWVSSQQQQLSWFKGGTEIELTPLPGVGYQLRYTDLHQFYLLTR